MTNQLMAGSADGRTNDKAYLSISRSAPSASQSPFVPTITMAAGGNKRLISTSKFTEMNPLTIARCGKGCRGSDLLFLVDHRRCANSKASRDLGWDIHRPVAIVPDAYF